MCSLSKEEIIDNLKPFKHSFLKFNELKLNHFKEKQIVLKSKRKVDCIFFFDEERENVKVGYTLVNFHNFIFNSILDLIDEESDYLVQDSLLHQKIMKEIDQHNFISLSDNEYFIITKPPENYLSFNEKEAIEYLKTDRKQAFLILSEIIDNIVTKFNFYM